MIGSARTIRSPSRVRARRSTPCVAGCCGPMLRTMSAVAMSPVATVSSRRSPVVVTSPAMRRILARSASVAAAVQPTAPDNYASAVELGGEHVGVDVATGHHHGDLLAAELL